MKKRVLTLLVASTMLLSMFAGCGNSQEDVEEGTVIGEEYEGNVEEATVIEEVDGEDVEKARNDMMKAPNEILMATDLAERGANCFSLNYCDEYLRFASLQIIKRNTDLGCDVATVIAVLENENYRVNAEYTLYYSFYDVGGWILDEYTVDSYESIAIAPIINEEEWLSECKEIFTTFEKTDRSYGDNYDKMTILAEIDSKFLTETFGIDIEYEYYDNAWHSSHKVKPLNINFDKFLGTWQFRHYDEYIKVRIDKIELVDLNNINVTYEYETSPWFDEGPWEGYFREAETNGLGHVEPLKTERVTIAKIGNEYVKSTYSKLNKFEQVSGFGLELRVGQWEAEYDFNERFYVNFVPRENPYMTQFRYKYKSPEITTSWEWISDVGKAYFEKDKNLGEVQNAIDKLKEMNS